MIALINPDQLQKKRAAIAARCAISRNTAVPQFVLYVCLAGTGPSLFADFMKSSVRDRICFTRSCARIPRANVDLQARPTRYGRWRALYRLGKSGPVGPCPASLPHERSKTRRSVATE